MKRIAIILVSACAMLPSRALACAVCFGDKGDKMSGVASWSILFLLGVLLIVLGSIGYFIYTLARRSRELGESPVPHLT
jgi:hypothetical protein